MFKKKVKLLIILEGSMDSTAIVVLCKFLKDNLFIKNMLNLFLTWDFKLLKTFQRINLFITTNKLYCSKAAFAYCLEDLKFVNGEVIKGTDR
jgi:hypothetical protein